MLAVLISLLNHNIEVSIPQHHLTLQVKLGCACMRTHVSAASGELVIDIAAAAAGLGKMQLG